MIGHIAYEVVALEASARFSCSWIGLEAFLLHVRNLREFLWGRRTCGSQQSASDLFASDYAKDWDTSGLPATLGKTKDAVNQQLSHISRGRRDSKKARDFARLVPDLRREIMSRWREFLKVASWAGEFQDSVHKWKVKLGIRS